jgi:hypothetical protein
MFLPLPNGKTQFLSSAGVPLAGGSVYHYVPGTSTLFTTYQDYQGTVANTNPITLDSAGEAIIFVAGAVRQVVYDASGNLVWDQVSQVPTLAGLNGLSNAGGTLTAGLTMPSLDVVGNPSFTITPVANTLTSYATVNFQGAAAQVSTREILTAISWTSGLGSTASGGNQDKIALAVGVDAQAGTGNVWGEWMTVQMDASSGTYNAIGMEIDLNNNVANLGTSLGAAGLVAPVAYGAVLTGAGTFTSTGALAITGPGTAIWNRGIVLTENSVAQAGIQDLGSDVISYEMQGSHTTGIDTKAASFSLAAILIGNSQHIRAVDSTGSVDLSVAYVNSANQLVVGDANNSVVLVAKTFAPNAATSFDSGASNLPWRTTYTAQIISAALQSSTSYANDAAAAGGGVTLGQFYRNGNVVQIRIV